ncbi:GIY-YIG nuclease family protein [Bacillus lacus]|uniref:GIY-YIG nuclease family protein n=1 Tax=Metabacillus lacus TaxID=1983721 RepID=A0A7X2J0D3_9BACI|nr:GIY-YIG nuclease family protein [Metabacillus lacus]MRX72939.1 GIY-YIG nuclease family protein [Metabacillus lacus]
MESNHFFYVLKCSDGSYYAGYSNNVEKRVQTHNDGKGAKYTRSRRPVSLLYQEHHSTKGDALKAEQAFKKKSRKAKERYLLENQGRQKDE